MAFDKNYDHLLKVLLTGDSSVGKTSLICQFVDNETRQTHIATIGESREVKCDLLRTANGLPGTTCMVGIAVVRQILYSIYTVVPGGNTVEGGVACPFACCGATASRGRSRPYDRSEWRTGVHVQFCIRVEFVAASC